jgi:hypothetical protein
MRFRATPLWCNGCCCSPAGHEKSAPVGRLECWGPDQKIGAQLLLTLAS